MTTTLTPVIHWLTTLPPLTDHDAVASIFELGENWQKAMGLSSPIWLQELVSNYRSGRENYTQYSFALLHKHTENATQAHSEFLVQLLLSCSLLGPWPLGLPPHSGQPLPRPGTTPIVRWSCDTALPHPQSDLMVKFTSCQAQTSNV